MSPFQRESQGDTENYILNTEVIFPGDDFRVVSSHWKNLISFLLNKNEKIRNNYTVEEIIQSSWFHELQLVAGNINDDLYEPDYELIRNEYREKRETIVDSAFQDVFTL